MKSPSRLIMGLSGLYLLAGGGVLNFAPAEFADLLGIASNAVLPLQLWAGVLLGAGVTNWMSRGSTLGGIYGRPLCLGNFLHFAVGAFTLVRFAVGAPLPLAWLLCGIYAAFALCFAWLMFFGQPAADS